MVFALVRVRRGETEATWAAISVAVSPVLFLVSGFHGNTDPEFTFLTLLSVYFLVVRQMPGLAGGALALAIGVKIVPMVLIPVLVIYAFRQGRRALTGFVVVFAVVFALTWGPALILEFRAVRADVLGYGGIGYSLWGFLQFGHWLGDPGWVAFATGPGRTLLVILCAVVPAIAVWRRPTVLMQAVAWSLIVFLALATTFGVQYLVWPVAACYLVSFRLATLYNISAGVILAEIYNRWSGGLPWYYADPTVFTTPEKVWLLVPWATLVVIAVLATNAIFPRRSARDRAAGQSVAGAAIRRVRLRPAVLEVTERKSDVAPEN